MEIDKFGELSQRTFSLDMLRTFVAISEHGSFRSAAAQRYRSPSAVSLQILKLEELLGVQLMLRDARRVELTDQGSILLSHARRLLRLNDETFAQFRASPITGRLRLSAPLDLGATLVPKFLRELSSIHPKLQVDVRLGTSGQVTEQFLKGAANIVLFNDVGAPEIPSQSLFSEPLKWLCLDGGKAVSEEPLPIAIADSGCSWRNAVLDGLGEAGRRYRIAYSSDTSIGQIAAIRADLAIAALPISLIGNELVEVSSVHNLPALPITHIRIADDGSEAATAFAATIADGFSQRKCLISPDQ